MGDCYWVKSWAGEAPSFNLVDGTYPSGHIQVRNHDVVFNVSNHISNPHPITIYTLHPPNVIFHAFGTVTGVSMSPHATSWEYNTDGSDTWQNGTDPNFILGDGTYAIGNIQVRNWDVFGAVSSPTSNTGKIFIGAPGKYFQFSGATTDSKLNGIYTKHDKQSSISSDGHNSYVWKNDSNIYICWIVEIDGWPLERGWVASHIDPTEDNTTYTTIALRRNAVLNHMIAYNWRIRGESSSLTSPPWTSTDYTTDMWGQRVPDISKWIYSATTMDITPFPIIGNN